MISDEKKASCSRLNQRIKDCTKCPYQFDDKIGVKKLGTFRGDEILFVSQSPSPPDRGRIKDLNIEALLKEYCGIAKIDWENVSTTFFCKTEVPPSEALKADEKMHCLGHVLEEIVTLRPKMIITLGSLAKEYFDIPFHKCLIGEFNILGKEKEHGRIVETLHIPVLTLFHPSAVAYGNLDKAQYITDLKKAYHVGQRENRKLAERGK